MGGRVLVVLAPLAFNLGTGRPHGWLLF